MFFHFFQYVKFLLNSTNQHGVHSPFVYRLVTTCFYTKVDKKQIAQYREIQKNALQVRNVNLSKLSCKKPELLLKVIGYFKAGELVGFYTVFFEKEVMESHYLGINQEENRHCQLYINMLYDMVKMGIYHEVKRIFLARTALEIKSSVGAEPHDLYFYLKNHNPIFNALAHKTFDVFNPQEEWTQRKPFK